MTLDFKNQICNIMVFINLVSLSKAIRVEFNTKFFPVSFAETQKIIGQKKLLVVLIKQQKINKIHGRYPRKSLLSTLNEY